MNKEKYSICEYISKDSLAFYQEYVEIAENFN